jgi:hypothetical protein
MNKYLFVSYQIASESSYIVSDICFVADMEKKDVTIRYIREQIKAKIEREHPYNNWCDPAIIGISELNEDVAKMLYELE